MSNGSLNINGANITVNHADGTSESFSTLRTRAEASLPAELQGSMDQTFVAEKTGNVCFSFGKEFFVRKDGKGDQEYRLIADRNRVKRLLISSAIINELLAVGVPWDHMTFKDTYFKAKLVNGKPVTTNGRTEGTYEPTMQLWLNGSRTSQGVTTSGGPSLQDLSNQFVMSYEDAVEGGTALATLKGQFEGDSVTFMSVLSAAIAKKKIVAAAGPVVADENEMPQG